MHNNGGTLLQLSPLNTSDNRFKGQLELVTDSLVRPPVPQTEASQREE
jgi:hypothetical protein